MFRNILFSLLFILMASVSSFAQNDNQRPLFKQMGFLSWDVNIPVDNDFVSSTSYKGGSFGFRKMLKNGKVSVGGDISWNTFQEYADRKTYQLENNGAVTTDFVKYIYTLPLSLNSHYYFTSEKLINPYIGIGIGATYASEELYYNTYVTEDDQWGFLVRPEVGAIIKFQPYSGWGIILGGRYNYSTNEQTDFDIKSLQSLELQLGIAWNW
jgi:hypothetical protein